MKALKWEISKMKYQARFNCCKDEVQLTVRGHTIAATTETWHFLGKMFLGLQHKSKWRWKLAKLILGMK